MKKRIIIISIVCVLAIAAIIAVCLVLFQSTNAPENSQNKNPLEPTIKNFENAFNSYDFAKMMDCIHPTYREALKVAADLLSLFGAKPKWNLSFVLNLAKIGIPLLPYIPNVDITSDDLPHLSLSVTDYEINGDNAECTVLGVLTVGDLVQDFENVVVMEKIDDVWYIVNTK